MTSTAFPMFLILTIQLLKQTLYETYIIMQISTTKVQPLQNIWNEPFDLLKINKMFAVSILIAWLSKLFYCKLPIVVNGTIIYALIYTCVDFCSSSWSQNLAFMEAQQPLISYHSSLSGHNV